MKITHIDQNGNPLKSIPIVPATHPANLILTEQKTEYLKKKKQEESDEFAEIFRKEREKLEQEI